jgi:hypothetical protein
MSIISKLRHGRHYRLFDNGLALTARLAWGLPRPADPSLATWLGDNKLFEQHGNGIVIFSSRLTAQAKAQGIVPDDRLAGIMRWRYAHDCFAMDATGNAVEGLSTIGCVMVAGGWSDVASGQKLRSETHFPSADIAVKPYDSDLIDGVLLPLGWQSTAGGYRKQMTGRRPIRLDITPRLEHVGWPPETDERTGVFYAHGPALILMFAQKLLVTTNPLRCAQILDRIVNDLSDAQSLADVREYAAQKNATHVLDKAQRLLSNICGGPLEGRISHTKGATI